MEMFEQVKVLALEILHLIDYGDIDNPKTYANLGDKIEKLANMRLDIIKTPYLPKRSEK